MNESIKLWNEKENKPKKNASYEIRVEHTKSENRKIMVLKHISKINY